MVIKDFAHDAHEQPGRYGPPRMITSSREQMTGLIDIPLESICTSHVERNNVNIRMFISVL